MAATELQPILLHLINKMIVSGECPNHLKWTKIVPIRKADKDDFNMEGWRPINVVVAISKLVEKVLLRQILKHLKDNQLIHQSHHGSVRGKSTQILVVQLHDILMEDLQTITITKITRKLSKKGASTYRLIVFNLSHY